MINYDYECKICKGLMIEYPDCYACNECGYVEDKEDIEIEVEYD